MTALAAMLGFLTILAIVSYLKLENMMATLDDLKAQVIENSSVVNSAMVLIDGLAVRLQAVANDPAKLQALIDELKASDTALADAIAKNTVANQEASEPVAVPVEVAPTDMPPTSEAGTNG